jgi:hypothetical protein
MKIRMNVSVAGPGLRLTRGQTYDLPDNRALEFVACQYAAAVAAPQPERREKATRKSIEIR